MRSSVASALGATFEGRGDWSADVNVEPAVGRPSLACSMRIGAAVSELAYRVRCGECPLAGLGLQTSFALRAFQYLQQQSWCQGALAILSEARDGHQRPVCSLRQLEEPAEPCHLASSCERSRWLQGAPVELQEPARTPSRHKGDTSAASPAKPESPPAIVTRPLSLDPLDWPR